MSKIEVQGHRGCRGLLPENTIVGFLKAVELGVDVLEMDVVISGDSQVVVSHESWMSTEICLDAAGNEIREEEQRQHRIFGMTMDQVGRFDCGLKPHPRFPSQEKVAATKPRLLDMAREVESKLGPEAQIGYNIELKRHPEGDGVFQPEVRTFAQLVLDAVRKAGIFERTTIQAFDIETLQVVRELAPDIRLVLLVQNDLGHEANIEQLGFLPEIYSPDFTLVNEEMIAYCRSRGIRVIPWTANEVKDFEHLIHLGVDGIITDYPDRLLSYQQR